MTKGLLGRQGWVLLGFLVIGGFFLATEHRAHLFGVLPFLFLLACPFLHMFSHGHHGSDRHRHDPEKKDQALDRPSGGNQ